jgi:hypothetical protein
MYPQISPPIAINVIGLVGVIALSGFIATRIMAAAPEIAIPAPSSNNSTHVVSQQTYNGVIAWVSASEIKIVDTTGVSRVFSIDKHTNILVSGFPVGSATYANLPMLRHVRITTVKDGSAETAQTIVTQ